MITNNKHHKIYKTALLLVCCFSLVYFSASCQRDDICAQDAPTTPQLIIKFIDNETAIDIKRPIDLEIRSTDPMVTGFIPDLIPQDSIMIPLKADASITQLVFITNANNEDASLIRRDTVDFSYTPQEEYVNSACGFKVSYLGLGAQLARDEISMDEDKNWIKNIIVQQKDITNEANAHVLILH